MNLQIEPLKQHTLACYERLANYYRSRTRPSIRDSYLQPLLKLPAQAKILDAGSGTGHDIVTLASKGYHVVGIDISPSMCKLARKIVAGKNNVEIINGDVDTYSFRENDFSAVLSSMEIFHHPDLEATLTRYSRLLKPGGLFVLVTNHPVRNALLFPGRDYFCNDYCWEDWGEHGKIPKYHWSLGKYMNALKSAEFSIPEIREYCATKDLIDNQDVSISRYEGYPSIIVFISIKRGDK